MHARPQIHWFSIINSCVTVLLLTGFLATILMRVLKNDFIKYTRDDEAGARAAAPDLAGPPLSLQTVLHMNHAGLGACVSFVCLKKQPHGKGRLAGFGHSDDLA
jgi:hypothetical protein